MAHRAPKEILDWFAWYVESVVAEGAPDEVRRAYHQGDVAMFWLDGHVLYGTLYFDDACFQWSILWDNGHQTLSRPRNLSEHGRGPSSLII